MSWIAVSEETVSAPKLVTRQVLNHKGEICDVATKVPTGAFIVTKYTFWSCWTCKKQACTTNGYQPSKCCCGAQ